MTDGLSYCCIYVHRMQNQTSLMMESLGNVTPTSPVNLTQMLHVKDIPCEIFRETTNIIIALLCLLGIAGNVVTFVVFLMDTIKTSSSFLFQALAVVDTFFLITTAFLFPARSNEWFSNHMQAYVQVYIFPFASIAQTAAIWGTILIAVNRYIAVCIPFQAARWCTVRQARIQFIILIVCAVAYCIPEFFRSQLITMNIPTYGANGTLTINRATNTAFGRASVFVYKNVMYFIFLLALPLLIVTLLNVRLIYALNELRKKRSEMQSLRQQQDNNITLVLIVVIFIFIFCQVPALFNQIFWYVLPKKANNELEKCNFHDYFREISNTLVIFNSAVNFVIYCLFNTRFRQVLQENFPCYCIKRPAASQSTRNSHSPKQLKATAHQKHQANDGTRDTLL